MFLRYFLFFTYVLRPLYEKYIPKIVPKIKAIFETSLSFIAVSRLPNIFENTPFRPISLFSSLFESQNVNLAKVLLKKAKILPMNDILPGKDLRSSLSSSIELLALSLFEDFFTSFSLYKFVALSLALLDKSLACFKAPEAFVFVLVNHFCSFALFSFDF